MIPAGFEPAIPAIERPQTNPLDRAAIEAQPEWAGAEIQLHSDSQYVKNGITSWIKKWQKNGWKSSSGGAVKNKELWEELDALVSRRSIEWLWVPGHEGVMYNEMCDTLARARASEHS